jgi:AhpD family alkylhydroperoxidase
MPKDVFAHSTPKLAEMRKKLVPDVHDAFAAFSERVFAAGALPAKTKQLIAVAAAHVTQCPYCIRGHTKAALREGATAEEIMEAIWVAAEMRSGATDAHSAKSLRHVAKGIESGGLTENEIAGMSTTDALARLIELPGIGAWSAA